MSHIREKPEGRTKAFLQEHFDEFVATVERATAVIGEGIAPCAGWAVLYVL